MTPSFGELQTVILVAFAAIAIALALLFAAIARRSVAPVPFERVRDTGYALRRAWLAILVALLSAAVGASLLLLPYDSDAEATTSVRVTGGQFYWSMSPETVPAGSRVRFEVTSADVNHGFGLYHPDGYLMGNVQAMPGYTNDLVMSLEDPGTYLISCLEFCGINHHEMVREFEVTEE